MEKLSRVIIFLKRLIRGNGKMSSIFIKLGNRNVIYMRLEFVHIKSDPCDLYVLDWTWDIAK